MQADVTKEVIGKWPSTLLELGIPEEFLTGKHGPCPMCGGKDRFRFTEHRRMGKVCFFNRIYRRIFF